MIFEIGLSAVRVTNNANQFTTKRNTRTKVGHRANLQIFTFPELQISGAPVLPARINLGGSPQDDALLHQLVLHRAHIADGCEELVAAERLHDIAIGAKLERFKHVSFLVRGRQHDD